MPSTNRRVIFNSRNAWLIAFALVVFKALVFGAAYLLLQSQGLRPNYLAWDVAYYHQIVTQGYFWVPDAHGPLAFFPLLPILIKGIMVLTGLSFPAAGIGLNLFLYGTFSFLFMRWASLVGIRHYWLPALFMTLDRFTLWSSIPYTEPLFLNLMMLFLLVLRVYPERKASTVLLAAAVGGLASASRMVGVALVAALGCGNFMWFLRKRPFLGALCLLLGLGGVIAFFSYLQLALGAWDLSLKTTAHWGRHFSLLGFFNSLYYLFKQFYFPTVISFILAVWAMARTPRGIAFSPTEKWLTFWLIFIPMANSIPVGISRYFSVLFVAPVMLSYFCERVPNKLLRLCVGAVFTVEIYWQVQLLAKFYRAEVFSWAA